MIITDKAQIKVAELRESNNLRLSTSNKLECYELIESDLKLPADATFTRSSVAYLSDGTQVPANQPRFEQGKFGKAIMVEEGTTNLFNINNVRKSNTYVPTEIISDYHVIAYYDNPTGGAGNWAWSSGWFYIIYNAPFSQGNYALSFDAKILEQGDYDTVLKLRLINGDSVILKDLGTIELSQEFKHFIVQFNVDVENADALQIALNSNSVEFKNIQLEAKPYATSFIDGTRSPESLTIPTAGVLNPQEGTVECWFYYKPNGAYQRIVSFVGSRLNEYRDLQFDITPANKIRFQPKRLADGTGGVSVTSASPITEGWHYAVCTWNQSEIKVAVDNQPVQKLSYGGGIATLDAFFTVGKEHNNIIAYINSYIDDLRISSIARSDEEILAAYQSGQPLPADEWTTYKLDFDDKVRITTQGQIICNELIEI